MQTNPPFALGCIRQIVLLQNKQACFCSAGLLLISALETEFVCIRLSEDDFWTCFSIVIGTLVTSSDDASSPQSRLFVFVHFSLSPRCETCDGTLGKCRMPHDCHFH